MKSKITFLIFLATTTVFAQKKKNGNIYIEHPANQIVLDYLEAFSNNDSLTVSKIISDNYKGFSGENMDKDDEPTTKEELLEAMKNWNSYVDYLSIKHTDSGYPDAVEYADDNFSDLTWVYSWEVYTGVHKETGVKLNMPAHFQYVVDKNDQIVYSRGYMNQTPFNEIGDSYAELTIGKMYSHHPNINKVRRMLHAYEFDDLDTAYAFIAEDATIWTSSFDWADDRISFEDAKKMDQEFLSTYTINSLDDQYVFYAERDRGTNFVESIWRLDLTRKSDNTNIVLPVRFVHRFNDEDEIIYIDVMMNFAKL